MENFLRDIRFALRSLRKDPHFTFAAIVALGLGIGATTVIFSVIDSVLLRPFSYKNADRLTTVYEHFLSGALDRPWLEPEEVVDFKEQNHSFEDMIGFGALEVFYSGREATQWLVGGWVTPNTFDFLGVKPLLGRPIGPADGNPSAPPVFLMSYRMWEKEFNRDPKMVGAVFSLNGQPRTLVAIMPKRFLFFDVDIWIPLNLSRDTALIGANNIPAHFGVLGRLKKGISLRAAAADLDVIAQRFVKRHPGGNYPEPFTILTKSLTDSAVGPFRAMLFALTAAVTMLLLIACSNVANLLLARATVREREIAVRAALGAGRGRLISQLLVESFLLAMGGCITGCVLAYFGLKEVIAIIPPDTIPSEVVITLNRAALLFALGLTILTTLLCGLVPAVHAVGGDLHTRLIGSSKGVNKGFRHGRFRAGLVIAEVAFSIVLLIGSGLMIRSLIALHHVDLGFNAVNVLDLRVTSPPGRYDTAEQKKLFFQKILGRVTAIPGVITAGVHCCAAPPLAKPFSLLDVPGKTYAEASYVQFELCSEGYFQTLNIPLKRGRLFSEGDMDSARRVAVINQSTARSYFSGEDPIGQRIKFSSFDPLPGYPHNAYFEIVGIVGDAKNSGLRDPVKPEAYIPYPSVEAGNRSILVKTAVDPLSLLPTLRREILATDPNVALINVETLESFLKRTSYAQPQFGLFTLGTFAGIGLLLVVIGVFSVMAYTVSLQRHEIGIRMALGAQHGDVLRMVLKKGLGLVTAGIVIGVLASLGLTRFLASQIWGVSVTDPWTFAAVTALILAVGLIASFLPARNAARVDPLITLRYE
jgi:putative ABC transport system permease protein